MPARTVLFLGAGASRPFGYPLAAEILPAILERLGSGALFGDRGLRSRQRLRGLLAAFLPSLAEPGAGCPDVLELLSLLDQLVASEGALGPGLDLAELRELRGLLERALSDVLDFDAVEAPPRSRARLRRLAAWIAGAPGRGEAVDLVTTNYDLELDAALHGPGGPLAGRAAAVDFGFAWRSGRDRGRTHRLRPRPSRPRLRLYKLHGSLNWAWCPQCGHLTLDPDGRPTRLPESTRRDAACLCGQRPLRRLLVAPSMVRTVRNPALLGIWDAALEALREAARWIVVGYSLPPEDVAIRALLLRAWRGRPRPPEGLVITQGPDPALEARWRLFFPGLGFDTRGMEGFVDGLEEAP